MKTIDYGIMKKAVNDLLIKMQNNEICIDNASCLIVDLYKSSHDENLLNAYLAGALETLTSSSTEFKGYDHLLSIKEDAKEWKERFIK